MKMSVLLAASWLIATGAEALTLVTEKEIHQATAEFVRGELEGAVDPLERFEIRTRWQGVISLPVEGPAEVEIDRISARPFRGPTVVRAEVRVGGETHRVLTITVDTRFFRHVLVAARSIRRGEAIAADMVELTERDVTSIKDGFFTDLAELAGYQAKRPLGFDRVVTRSHVEAVPVVRRGDAVLLLVASANLQISAAGTALQDGSVGRRIRVKNQDSGKVLWGEVMNSRTVRIGL